MPPHTPLGPLRRRGRLPAISYAPKRSLNAPPYRESDCRVLTADFLRNEISSMTVYPCLILLKNGLLFLLSPNSTPKPKGRQSSALSLILRTSRVLRRYGGEKRITCIPSFIYCFIPS